MNIGHISIAILLILALRSTGQVSVDLDSLLITTSRIPQTARQTGRNVTIIPRKTIEQSYATSLDDLLKQISGVEVLSRGGFGVQGDITMRGSTYTQVLVLIDGMKLNDPLTAHFNSNIPVSIVEIDRIEILRGAAAAMYGADAVGGVINVITKGSNIVGSDFQDISGEINLGQHRLLQSHQGWSRKKGRFYLGGGFSMNQSDGETLTPQAVSGPPLETYNSYFDVKTVGLSGGYKWEDGWQLNARMAYDDRDFAARYFYTTSTFDKSTETTRNWWNQVRLQKVGNRSSTDINMAYKYNTDLFVFSPDFPSTNSHVSKLWNLNVGHLISLSHDATLRVGAQIDRRSIESTDRGDHSDMHYGLYATSMVQPTTDLFVTASIRMDNDNNYGLEITPQINVSYAAGDAITLRGSAGRSIRAADYTERYVSYKLDNLTPGRSLGNPDLNAERAWSYEIGIDLLMTEAWKLKTTAFARASSDLIDYISTNADDIPGRSNLQAEANYFYATNIAEVNTNGLEIESWLTYSISQKTSIQWAAGYTHLRTTNDQNAISVYLSSHADHLITSQLIVNHPSWELSLNGLYKSRPNRIAEGIAAELEDSYQVWSTRLRLHLTAELSAQIQVHNMWDRKYQDILGAPMPGRWMSAGVRIQL